MKFLLKLHTFSLKDILLVILCLFVFFVPYFVYAAGSGGTSGGVGSGGTSGGGLQNPIQANSVQALAAQIINIVVKVGAPIVVFFLIYVGFLFVTARGNVETLETAKNALLWTFIGGLILLGAQGLSSVICGTIDTISDQTTCS